MNKRWVPLLTWTLEARRYDDAPEGQDEPGIDLRDLKKLVELREAIVEYVADLWRRDNPGKRLPRNWKESIELRFFRTEKGSCHLAVHGAIPDVAPSQHVLFADASEPAVDRTDIRTQLPEATDRVALTLNYVTAGKKPPFRVPNVVMANVRQLARTVDRGDLLRIAPVPPPVPTAKVDPVLAPLRTFGDSSSPPGHYGAPSAPANPVFEGTTPRLWAAMGHDSVLDVRTRKVVRPVVEEARRESQKPQTIGQTFSEPTVVLGSVHKADVDTAGARVVIDGRKLNIQFSAEDEKEVTGALHKREAAMLRIEGMGVFDAAKGTLLRIDPPIRVKSVDAENERREEQLALALPTEGGIVNSAVITIEKPLTNDDSMVNGRQVSTGVEEDMAAEFERLKEEWLEDTKFMSSMSKITGHPAYQAIIRMGPPVIPFILRDLEATPKHWGPALFAITGARPVRKEDAGRLRKAAEAWLDWAREHGYEW